jgi:predicted PP-loop superfamily ATPase
VVAVMMANEILSLRLLGLLHLRRGRVDRGRVVRGYRGGVDGLAVGVLARDKAHATLLVRVLLLELAQELLDDFAQRTALVRDVLAKSLVGVLEILVSPGSPGQYM